MVDWNTNVFSLSVHSNAFSTTRYCLLYPLSFCGICMLSRSKWNKSKIYIAWVEFICWMFWMCVALQFLCTIFKLLCLKYFNRDKNCVSMVMILFLILHYKTSHLKVKFCIFLIAMWVWIVIEPCSLLLWRCLNGIYANLSVLLINFFSYLVPWILNL